MMKTSCLKGHTKGSAIKQISQRSRGKTNRNYVMKRTIGESFKD